MREARVLDWLAGRLNVPEVVLTAESAAGEYMVTRCVPGEPLFGRIHAQQPVLDLFLEALRQVQAVPVAACPFDASASFRLRELEYLLANGLIADDYDVEKCLHTPQELLIRLHATLPREELVFSHGDLGDSNVFVDARDELYFIDLGRGGKADRWMDIAFVHRNLREEVSEDVAADFLDALDQPDARTKREFFEQLDELF
jgi:aminoglycoside phosphotransferase